jgi:hypothetical protein
MKWLGYTILFLSTTVLAQTRAAIQSQPGIEFSNKCYRGEEVTVSAVGDVLLHAPLQNQAFNHKEAYQSLWPAMVPIFEKFDVSYANFEGPSAEGLAGSGKLINEGFKANPNVYTSYPSFNYHPVLIQDLMASGIDVVSTANNHALDRREKGADMTIEAMLKYGLKFTGTRPRGAQNQGWHTFTETKGLRIAWLACTFSTNGIPDRENQVLACYQDRQKILNDVQALAKDPSISAVIVTPHWGEEYSLAPAKQEIAFRQQLIDAGALAVLGTHPHVIQPWQKYESKISGKEGLIVFSSGNFVSGQFHRVPTQVGLMIGLKLVLDSASKQLKIKTARFLPLMMKRYPYRVEPVLSDEGIGQQFTTIWTSLYPKENRITNLDEMFPNECL